MKNFRNLSLALFIALALMIILIVLFSVSSKQVSPGLYRFVILLGGDIKNGGYIQIFTYFAFFWSWFEAQEKLTGLKRERRAFKLNIIPS